MHKSRSQELWVVFVCLICGPAIALGAPVADSPRSVVDEVRFESTLSRSSALGRPLPLVGSWNTGLYSNTFDPNFQLKLISQGHHLIPWFQLHSPRTSVDLNYYKQAIQVAARLRLPISFVSTQWEHILSDDPTYFWRSPERNPNVMSINGERLREVSPFGPLDAWNEAGREWTRNSVVEQLQEWYPNPPLVLFVSNNEHRKLVWTNANNAQDYVARFGKHSDDHSKRLNIGEGWILRYRALQEGLSQGLRSVDWKANAKFVGYDAFGTPAFGRWSGWKDYSLYTPGRMEPWPLAWDGVSVSYYVHDWDTSTDYTVQSPQIASMNWLFMLDEAYVLNPDLWFEMSVWDGHQPGYARDKRAVYARLGQTYGPDRYVGAVKFGMWLLRPRSVREFRFPTQTRSTTMPYFSKILDAVDAVHNDSTLRAFWRRGTLVANRAHTHPYMSAVPSEHVGKDRWFLLDTSLDPRRPWTLQTEIPVFALALEIGKTPAREWLVYTHAPLGTQTNVDVTIPNYGRVRVDPTPAGSYYHVREAGRTVNKLSTTE